MASKNENTGRIILVVVGILVLSALGYFATKYFAQAEVIEKKDSTIEDLQQEVSEIDTELRELQVTLEDKNVELAEKDRLLEEQYSKIEELVSRLNRYKNTSNTYKRQLQDMESRLKLLQASVKGYKTEIDSLKMANQALTGQVSNLEASQDQLREERSALIETTEEQKAKLEVAAILKAADFRVANVRKNGKEKFEKEFRRGSLQTLKLCFSILENPLGKSGSKELFLVYENPDGTVSTNTIEGYSGKFTYQGKSMMYSAKAVINYQLVSQEACIAYAIPKEEKYQKGTQYVSLYQGDYLIGQGSFKVK
ncbi:MAG: hypothetical protein AAGI38_14550 [Bacteroidota bacterium]